MDIETKLREALDGVTPGSWVAEQSTSRKYLDAVLFQYQSGMKGTVALIGKEAAQVGASELDEQNANSAYIALCSPNNISALLDTIASLRSKLEEAEGALTLLLKMHEAHHNNPIHAAARRTLASLREADHA